MAGKVFFSVTMSLDGFIAPEERMDDPDVQRWMAQWKELQQWIFPQRFFRENLKLGEGGEEGRDNDIVRETFERTGASVMGKRMFDLGEQAWPEEAPFHTPVFVVTHEKRDPWERPGGTTFHFVNDGIEPALDQAREAAGDRDVRIAGGGATILEYVNAGLIDEFSIALSPERFGSGIRLFEGVDAGRVALDAAEREFRAQIERVLAAGIRPTHLDGHQHVPWDEALERHEEVAASVAGLLGQDTTREFHVSADEVSEDITDASGRTAGRLERMKARAPATAMAAKIRLTNRV